MRVKASYTVENSFIIPVFTFVIVLLMAAAFFIHDIVVINSGLWQAAMKIELVQENPVDEDVIENTKKKCEEFINAKTIFTGSVSVDVEKSANKTVATAKTESKLFRFSRWLSNTDKDACVDANNPADFIRIINAVKEVVV